MSGLTEAERTTLIDLHAGFCATEDDFPCECGLEYAVVGILTARLAAVEGLLAAYGEESADEFLVYQLRAALDVTTEVAG